MIYSVGVFSVRIVSCKPGYFVLARLGSNRPRDKR